MRRLVMIQALAEAMGDDRQRAAMFAHMKQAGGGSLLKNPAVKQQLALSAQAAGSTSMNQRQHALSQIAGQITGPKSSPTADKHFAAIRDKMVALRTGIHPQGAAAMDKLRKQMGTQKTTAADMLSLHHQAQAGVKSAPHRLAQHSWGQRLATAHKGAVAAHVNSLHAHTGVDKSVLRKSLHTATHELAATALYHAAKHKAQELMASTAESYHKGKELGMHTAHQLPTGRHK